MSLIAGLLWFLIGFAAGYVLTSKERRGKVFAKLNQWTAPKKPQPPTQEKPE